MCQQSKIFGLFLLVQATVSCDLLEDGKCPLMEFDARFGKPITSVTLYDNLSDGSETNPFVTIDDSDIIHSIKDFVLKRQDNWIAPAVGVPVGKLRVVFWENGKRLDSFSVGSDFIVAQGCGYFFSRSISTAERAELMNLLNFKFDFE